MNTLVIIESPYKAQSIKSILGKGYKVVASKGHVRDLPKSLLGIDMENGYEPKYVNIRGKGDLIKELRKEAKEADFVLLATDPDREGEAVSWHLMQTLGLDANKTKRITFNEITKSTLKEAIKHPRDIDMNLVDSQQTRRILDRLVGYKISPFLWKKIESGLSAGRVQSVATRIIVERDEEIKAFVPEEYWTITALLCNGFGEEFTARFYGTAGEKTELKNGDQVKKILSDLEKAEFTVGEIKKAVKTRKPLPPFTTSTLQQEANRRLSYPSQKTMSIAQELYEGKDFGHGLISYMRTDSVRISDEAREAAKKFITENYGDDYYPDTPNMYKSKKDAQDAHEAIRPSDPSITPESLKGTLAPDSYKLYKLIWERFVASQMKPAEFDTVSADINASEYLFKASGRTLKFAGFTAVYGEIYGDAEDESDSKLPRLEQNEKLGNKGINSEQKFTQPPSRYTEGSLIRVLEEKGIGRPATYTPTITTIIQRGYVKRDGKYLEPTELGRITNELMVTCFPKIVDYDFTANMETELDKIEEGKMARFEVIDDFYKDFVKQLVFADTAIDRVQYKKPIVETDIICEKCGAKMIIREGRFGKFAACPNYPKCRNTRSIDEHGKEKKPDPESVSPENSTDLKCPKCGKEMVLKSGVHGQFYACVDYPTCRSTMSLVKDTGVACPKCGKKIIVKQTKKKKVFYSCEGYPECDFSCWDAPVNEKCPVCNGLVLKKKTKQGSYLYCSNENCKWTKEVEE